MTIGTVLPTISRKVRENSPGLQGHSVDRAPLIIFSAERSCKTLKHNAQCTRDARASLRKYGVPFDSCTGSYKGVVEQAFIVRCDTPEDERIARALAVQHFQETVLHLSGERVATLQTCSGAHVADLGKLKAVCETRARRCDAWTRTDNNVFYICE